MKKKSGKTKNWKGGMLCKGVGTLKREAEGRLANYAYSVYKEYVRFRILYVFSILRDISLFTLKT